MNFGEFWSKFSENNSLSQSGNGSNRDVSEKEKKLKLLFDFFDQNKNGELDKAEMHKFTKLINEYSKKDGLNSLFSASEQELFLNEQSINKKSLAQNGINRSNLIDFLKIIRLELTGKKQNTIKTDNGELIGHRYQAAEYPLLKSS